MMAIAKGTVQTLVPGLLNGGTNSSGNLLQGIGGFLQGGGASTNQPVTTNQPPATNQPPVNNLLNRFLGPGTK
jgi:hypothetical protein